MLIRLLYFCFISIVISVSARADDEPSAGLKVQQDSFIEMLRGKLPGQESSGMDTILDKARSKIVSEIQKALQEANKPLEINSSQRINISRDLLQKPVLQEDGSYLSQVESWLKSIREAYSKDLEGDQQQWIEGAISNWQKIFKDMEEWELYVDYHVEVHPEIDQARLQYSIPESGPLVKVDAELQLDPLIRMKSVHLVLENPVTGEVFSLGDPKDFQADFYLSNTVMGTSSVELELHLNERNPIKAKIDPVQTNILPSSSSEGVLIRGSDVDVFMRKIFNQNRIELLISQALPGIQNNEKTKPVSSTRLLDQVESDITNYLRFRSLDVSLLLLETSDGKLKTDASILTPERKEEIRIAYESDRSINGLKIIGELRSAIPLELDESHLQFNHESQSILLDFDLLKSKSIRWNVEFFEASTAFIGGELDSPLLQSMFEKINLDQNRLRDVEIEADIDFSLTNSGLQIEIPLEWKKLDATNKPVPQVNLQNIEVNLPALSEARIQEIRLRSAKELEWVRLRLDREKMISDQLYTQLHSIIKNANLLLDKNSIDQLSNELSHSLLQISKEAEIDISSKSMGIQDPNAITSGTLRFVNFPLHLDAIHIDSVDQKELDLIKEFGFLSADNQTSIYSNAFDSLPENYQIFKNKEALYQFYTEIKLPEALRVRIDNFENAEAKVGQMEFNLVAEDEQQISVYWKLVQNDEGRMTLIPEFHNLKQVLRSYRPITEGSVAEGAPLIKNIIAKDPKIQGIEATATAGRAIGSAVASSSQKGLVGSVNKLVWGGLGRVSGAVSSEVESAKQAKLRDKLNTELISSAIKEVDPLVLFIVDASSGQPGSNSDTGFSLPYFQGVMEQGIEALLDDFRLRASLGEILLEDQIFAEKAEWKIKQVVDSIVRDESPFSSWPERLTNAGLLKTWNEIESQATSTFSKLPQSNLRSILGDPSSDTEGVNPFLQQKLREEVDRAHQATQQLKLSLNSIGHKEEELQGFQVNFPSHACRDSSFDSMASISLWYESEKNRNEPSLFQNEINETASKVFEGFERYSKPLDALAWAKLEAAQSALIEPNIEAARKLINEDLKMHMPGTEVEFDNIRLVSKVTEFGQEESFAYVDIKLRTKSGLIKFDSGTEFLTLGIPMGVNIFDETMRPEKKGDLPTTDVKIEIYPMYPIHIIDPNTGNIVEHLLKKYIAYPKLAEAIVHQPNSDQRRRYSISLPESLGLPLSGQEVGFDLSDPFFRTMSDGQSVVFVPIRYRFKQNVPENSNSPIIIVKP